MNFCFCFSSQDCLNVFTRARISIFKTLISGYKVRIRPNDNNQIKAQLRNAKNVDARDAKIDARNQLKVLECCGCHSCLGNCLRMDKKIVKLSFQILEKIRAEQDEENDKEELKIRIQSIESSLEKIMSKLNV